MTKLPKVIQVRYMEHDIPFNAPCLEGKGELVDNPTLPEPDLDSIDAYLGNTPWITLAKYWDREEADNIETAHRNNLFAQNAQGKTSGLVQYRRIGHNGDTVIQLSAAIAFFSFNEKLRQDRWRAEHVIHACVRGELISKAYQEE